MNLHKIPQIKHTESGNFFLLAGPCDIEGEEMAVRIAEKLVSVTDKLQIPFVFKGSFKKANRSRIDSFSGIGDGVFEPHKPEETERILSGLEGRADPSDNVARLFGQYGNRDGNDPAALAAVLRRPPAEGITAAGLSTLAQPALVAIGDKDFAFPSEKLASALPSSTLKILPRTDHFATPNSFSFIDALVQWLEENFT
jgi:pimeloyl-ACP methyl ester carboxylesterase